MKASRVQQLEPTSAINVEKLGIQTTINPLSKTNPVRRTVCVRMNMHTSSMSRVCTRREGGRERERERTYACNVVAIILCITEHSFQDLGHRKHHNYTNKTFGQR